MNNFCKKPLSECTQTLAAVALGKTPAETVITNANLINVCTAEIQEGVDIALAEGRIAYIGKAQHCIGANTQVIDAFGQYVAPGFLDGHLHVESSMVSAGEYACAVVPHGTVGIYWDPHEIANVFGLAGVQEMLNDVKRTPLKAMVTTPSCVPAMPGFEDTGTALSADAVQASMQQDDVVGLGEMMNFVGVLEGNEEVHHKLAVTLSAGKTVTGHYTAADLDQGLNAYSACGIRCCHESTQPEELLAKLRLGVYGQIRYGSAGQDLPQLVSVIVRHNLDTRFVNLVSDDVHPHTLVEEGHLDRILRKAVACGLSVIQAIQMLTINVATCFHMDGDLGSITPGKCADILFLNNLEDLIVTRVLIDGEVVAEDGKACFAPEPYSYSSWVTHSVNIKEAITPETFNISLTDLAVVDAGFQDDQLSLNTVGIPSKVSTKTVRAIEVADSSLITKNILLKLPVRNGVLQLDSQQDVLKAFVFERHHATGLIGKGLIKGFGVSEGAMASTVAHDAHNLLVVGSNNEDMRLAAQTLIDCGGGQVVVRHGKVLALVELPLAGLMSLKDVHFVSNQVKQLEQAWNTLGCKLSSPFMTMAFVSLACIPELRLTNRGLVDTNEFTFVSLAK